MAESATYDMALLKWGLETLLDMNSKFNLNDEKESTWIETLKHLADFHINENGFMIGKNVELSYGHRHFSHLFPIYPLHLVNVDNEKEYKLALKSFRHWFKFEGDLRDFTFIASSIIASTLGGDEALNY